LWQYSDIQASLFASLIPVADSMIGAHVALISASLIKFAILIILFF
jgi:hypothetical protein